MIAASGQGHLARLQRGRESAIGELETGLSTVEQCSRRFLNLRPGSSDTRFAVTDRPGDGSACIPAGPGSEEHRETGTHSQTDDKERGAFFSHNRYHRKTSIFLANSTSPAFSCELVPVTAVTTDLPERSPGGTKVKLTLTMPGLAVLFCTLGGAGQEATSKQEGAPIYNVTVIERTTRAINYQYRTGSTESTSAAPVLLPLGKGEATVEGLRVSCM
jgi:hypothetical protein